MDFESALHDELAFAKGREPGAACSTSCALGTDQILATQNDSAISWAN